MGQRILIIDDEQDIRATVEILLGRMGLETLSAPDLETGLLLIQHEPLDLVLTDMRLPDGTGLDVVRWIADNAPELPVAVITAYGSPQDAVAALKSGAFDYVQKPVDTALLRRVVKEALRNTPTSPSKLTSDPSQWDKASKTEGMVGSSAPMQELRRTIGKLARTQAPVFICGESGTGKELVAREMHRQSPRASGPFVAVNCGAIPAELFESELFGHRKGSFTGAAHERQGLFSAASEGTIFLDEVIDLPRPMQVKLLRALQERTVRPVGADREEPINVRVISAAQIPLSQAVQDQRLREDLYYRLNVLEIHLPALRERASDIPELCQALLERIAHRHNIPPPQLQVEALARLKSYHFPGNVRELENLLERACALADELGNISAQSIQLPSQVSGHPPSIQAKAQVSGGAVDNIDTELAESEKTRIEQALTATRWNRTQAAKQLGISVRSLRYRIKKLGLE